MRRYSALLVGCAAFVNSTTSFALGAGVARLTWTVTAPA